MLLDKLVNERMLAPDTKSLSGKQAGRQAGPHLMERLERGPQGGVRRVEQVVLLCHIGLENIAACVTATESCSRALE